ncbi:MAG: hypothetical protein VYA80_07665 [Pseudomonadota bacterium]|nr:hypothetical protein [Pseudomonadota bacterium]
MSRITYILYQYPQLSESYASTEMRSILDKHDIDIISLVAADVANKDDALPFTVIDNEAEILNRTRAFKPDIIHTHWLGPRLKVSVNLSKALDVPLTIRAHSFDVLWPKPRRRWYQSASKFVDTSSAIAENLDFLCSELCLGILTFPFSVQRLIGAGIPENKLIPCRPVLNFDRFYDESPNGSGVLNCGAALPKKDFIAYLELAQLVPDKHFDLYSIGYDTEKIVHRNNELNRPVTIFPPVQQIDMPAIYKSHEWFVYTANLSLGTVGWPVSISEAQASGVGVCMPNIRPDIKELLGPAGYIYNSIDEVAEIIRQPYPDHMRQAGFEHAKLSDIKNHIHLLTDLWKKV